MELLAKKGRCASCVCMGLHYSYICPECIVAPPPSETETLESQAQKVLETLADCHSQNYHSPIASPELPDQKVMEWARYDFLTGARAASKIYKLLGMIEEANFNPKVNQWGEKVRVISLEKELKQLLYSLEATEPEETWVDE